MLWLLFGAVMFVLLIGCANVANLSARECASRQKEMAIRAALGASRWRVMRQLFTESTILALTGGVVGLLVAFWGLPAITKLLPGDFPRLNEIRMDWRVLGFTFVASVLTGILFGLRRHFKSRGLTFRNRSVKLDAAPREASSESFSPGTDRWRSRFVVLCCSPARDCCSAVSFVCSRSTLVSFRNRY